MGLLSGLEKFGLSFNGEVDITDDGKKKEAKPIASETVEKKVEEKDFLIEKVMTCPVCDKKFPTLIAKTTRLKRLDPDPDLRPYHEGIDTLKYEVCSCPYCGYSALNKFFEHISQSQVKWIREAVGEKFEPEEGNDESKESYTYDEACDRYKLALICAMSKKAKVSEKSLICLRIAWMRRAQLKTMEGHSPEELAKIKMIREEMEGFYSQAFEGFQKALTVESPPFCGMNTITVDYLLANMAIHFKAFTLAQKLVGQLMTDSGTPQRVKDKCYDLKDKISAEMKKEKEKK